MIRFLIDHSDRLNPRIVEDPPSPMGKLQVRKSVLTREAGSRLKHIAMQELLAQRSIDVSPAPDAQPPGDDAEPPADAWLYLPCCTRPPYGSTG
mmetsp:Transcript_42877/g.96665  ORF Transcript_42877/g.96665 Transcript_42877/m.96665 type:complete len:94 (-) Transcript_42877:55-336(-)